MKSSPALMAPWQYASTIRPTKRLLARKLKVQPLRLSSTCTEAASVSATLTLMIASAASSPAIQARSSWQSITASPLKRNSLQPWREVAFVAQFLHEEGAAYGIDTERMGFAGDSGGAHLNLAATFYLRDTTDSIAHIKCLLLYYGWFGLTDSGSMRLLGGPWDGLAEEDWMFYQQLYANDIEELKTSPYAESLLERYDARHACLLYRSSRV